MVTKTPNLGLSKPAGTDLVDIAVLNGNMDILDEAVGKGSKDALLKTGGAMTGYLPDVNAGQVRNMFTSAREPTPQDGKDGDIWIQVEEV